MLTRRELVCLFVGAILATMYQAWSAPELTTEAGQCRFGAAPDSTFYNADLHTENYLHPGCWSAGVQDKWKNSKRFGWAARFSATGSVEVRDNLALPDETRHIRNGCNPPDETGCYARFNGKGNTYGLSVGLTAEQPIWSHLSVAGEVGVLFFQHHFKSEARLIDPQWGGGGRTISYNETSRFWDMPSPLVGVTLRWRDLYFAYRHYWPTGHRALTVVNFQRNDFMIGKVW